MTELTYVISMWCGFNWNIFKIISDILIQFIQFIRFLTYSIIFSYFYKHWDSNFYHFRALNPRSFGGCHSCPKTLLNSVSLKKFWMRLWSYNIGKYFTHFSYFAVILLIIYRKIWQTRKIFVILSLAPCDN